MHLGPNRFTPASMFRASCLALLAGSFTAFAQTPPAPTGGTAAPAAPAAASAPTNKELEELRREVETKVEGARKEIKDVREEVRAQLATQTAAQGWQEEAVEERRKLELFVPNGYLRVRPELFNKFDLNRAADPSGYTLFPLSPVGARERTVAGANMRFRFEPTLNVSEEVRIRSQIDILDNLVLGSTPEYAFSRGARIGYAWDRNEFSLTSESQVPPRSGINALTDSIAVKRVYGEVGTPVGILRFGRMGSNWGLGMVHNDGNCFDCDYGDTVDRIMFVSEPVSGYYVTPMFDFDAEGMLSPSRGAGDQPFDLSNSDDAYTLAVAVARRDTDMQVKTKLENDLGVFNYGLHLSLRQQRNDPTDFYGQAYVDEAGNLGAAVGGVVPRGGTLWTPDVWARYERRNFRVELEAAAVLGTINNRALASAGADTPGLNQSLSVLQFGGVLQGEYRLLDGALRIGLELGYASGDEAPGFGNYPRRKVAGTDNNTTPGDIDGPQYACQSTGGCTDNAIRNFRFNRAYRVDSILFRELLGGVTDAMYAKPQVAYRVAEGLDIFGGAIYSRSVFASSTPSAQDGATGDNNLGIELNVGAKYETEDGFVGGLSWGILFPLNGFSDPRLQPGQTGLETAQALRGTLGIKF